MVEVILALIGILFAIGFVLEKATNFIKQLKSNGSAKLSKGFEAKLSVVPINEKSEESAIVTASTSKKTIIE